MVLVGRRRSACFPVFSKEVCHSAGEGRNANFSDSGAARNEHPLPLLLPAEKPLLPMHLKPVPPSSFPEEMGRGMQTICEVPTGDIDLPSVALPVDKAGDWVITNSISSKRKKNELFSSRVPPCPLSCFCLEIWRKAKLSAALLEVARKFV